MLSCFHLPVVLYWVWLCVLVSVCALCGCACEWVSLWPSYSAGFLCHRDRSSHVRLFPLSPLSPLLPFTEDEDSEDSGDESDKDKRERREKKEREAEREKRRMDHHNHRRLTGQDAYSVYAFSVSSSLSMCACVCVLRLRCELSVSVVCACSILCHAVRLWLSQRTCGCRCRGPTIRLASVRSRSLTRVLLPL